MTEYVKRDDVVNILMNMSAMFMNRSHEYEEMGDALKAIMDDAASLTCFHAAADVCSLPAQNVIPADDIADMLNDVIGERTDNYWTKLVTDWMMNKEAE